MTKIEIEDTNDVVSVAEAAVLLNIGIATAWRWVNDGKLKSHKLFGRILIRKSELSSVNNKVDKV
jgi:excisionase family DNA binding protein